MDPLLPVETEVMEREADQDVRRKIQFSVPSSVPTQLDPRQVEMVRARGCSVEPTLMMMMMMIVVVAVMCMCVRTCVRVW